jgi:hypothetical protein
MSVKLDSPLPGAWTLYFHAPREKRWTLDTFQPIAKLSFDAPARRNHVLHGDGGIDPDLAAKLAPTAAAK